MRVPIFLVPRVEPKESPGEPTFPFMSGEVSSSFHAVNLLPRMTDSSITGGIEGMIVVERKCLRVKNDARKTPKAGL